MKKHLFARMLALLLTLTCVTALLPAVTAAGTTEPTLAEIGATRVVWDMEALPDSFDGWLTDRYVLLGWKTQGEVASGAGVWNPGKAAGKGIDGSTALAWTQTSYLWGSSTYVALGKDTTAVTDWTGAQNLFFYMDASELTGAVKAEILLQTADKNDINMAAGAAYSYWSGGGWVSAAVSEWNQMILPTGFTGWIKLPLAGVYGSVNFSQVQGIGFAVEHNQENASVYFDSFAIDAAGETEPETEPEELKTASVVWDMEALPDSFDNWMIDRYVENGWNAFGAIGESAGNWTASGVNGKGVNGSRALAWTVNKAVWGNATSIVLSNDTTAVTDWSGAKKLYFYLDCSQINVQTPTDVLLYSAADGEREMQSGAKWYYWNKTEWVENTINEWHHMLIPAKFKGWICLPISEVYGEMELRKMRRIGFLTEHGVAGGTVYFDQFSVDSTNGGLSFDKEKLAAAKTDTNLIPDTGAAETADYFCTWNTQCNKMYSVSGATVRDILTDNSLFGEDGWAYYYDKDIRKDLVFLLDDGWDLPMSKDGKDQEGYYGSFLLDPVKFPNYGATNAERLKTLVDKFKAAGWKGVGVWVCCQEDAAHRTGSTYDKAYWEERIRWCRDAGITYWKIDWGNYCTNLSWRRFITEAAERIDPNLVIEHITGDVGTNDPLGTGTCDAKLPRMLQVASFSDVFRTYDVTQQLSISTTMERVSKMLKGAYLEAGNQMGLLNCEDEVYLAATLGLSTGVMRSKATNATALDEVARAVRWHRIAPPFRTDASKTTLSTQTLADVWTFNGDTWDQSINGKTITQYAAAAVGRGIDLPTVQTQETVPYVAASRNALTGAISIGTFRRTDSNGANHVVYADVSLNVGDLTGLIGIFGCYESLTLTFSESIEGKRILAQDLLGNSAYDITQFVTVSDNKLTIQGDLLEALGTEAASANDTSEPGLVLRIGNPCNHVYVKDETASVAPSCTQPGKNVYVCTLCGAVKEEEVAALGHDYVKTENAFEYVYTCSRCGDTYTEEKEDVHCPGDETCPSHRFTDVPGPSNWAHTGIDFVVFKGLFAGTSQTAFSPNGSMTRAMLVTVLWQLDGKTAPVGSNSFIDVAAGAWYTDAVVWAAENNLVSGVGNGRFCPNQNVTREQLAMILYRYAEKVHCDTASREDLSGFPDYGRIGEWAKAALSWAKAEGLISGTLRNGTVYLDPKGNATRAQVAVMLMHYVRETLK